MNSPEERITEAIEVLTRPHLREAGDNTGVELPLLQILREAVSSSSPDGSTSPGKGQGSVIDAAALDLIGEIHGRISWEVDRRTPAVPIAGRSFYLMASGQGFLLEERVSHLFLHYYLPGGDNEWMADLLESWVTKIRNLIDPPAKPIPLRGVACPECQYDWFISDSKERVTALMANKSGAPLIYCRVCGVEYTIRDLHLFTS